HYTRKARIAQSSALPHVVDELASPIRDDSQGEACPTDSGLAADQDRELEINSLKARIKLLEDKDKGVADQSRDDAPIKGRRLDEGEEEAKRASDDTKEMATILTSMDVASILNSRGVQVVPTAAKVATATISIPTGSGVVSTTSLTIPTASLWYLKDSGFDLTAYSDADHAGCHLDQKSTSGSVQILGDKLMRTQLTDYGFFYDKVLIYCDSKSAIAISCNLNFIMVYTNIHYKGFILAYVDGVPRCDLVTLKILLWSSRTGIDLPRSLPSHLGRLGLGEYSQWVERFMNYLEEQTDGEAMINCIENGDQPLPRVTQVSIAGTSSTEQPSLKDKSMWSNQEKKIQKIDRLARFLLIQGLSNDIKCLIDSNKTEKDLWDALARHMLGSEYDEQDRNAAFLYEYKRSKRLKENCYLTLTKFVKSDDKKVEKKDDEKKRDMSKVKYYNCKKEGHFTKDCKKAKVKDYEYYKTKMLLANKDKDEQVLLAEDHTWIESSSDSNQEINANMVFMAQIEKVLSDLEASSSSTDDKISEVSFYLSESE
nr:hypothetical protein [Tanacetum cinerariifolium]